MAELAWRNRITRHADVDPTTLSASESNPFEWIGHNYGV